MSAPYASELQVAISAVRQAARLCVEVQRDLLDATMEKRDRSPVTVADFGSQAVICRELQAAFPNDPVIAEEDSAALRQADQETLLNRMLGHVRDVVGEAAAEEVLGWIDVGGGRDYTDRFWTLDPIDGTKGFLRGEQYAVALALIENGKPVVAALACPNLAIGGIEQPADGGSLYFAARGQGTYVTSCKSGDEKRPIHVSEIGDPTGASFCESVESGHSDQDLSQQIAARLGIGRPPARIDSQCKYAVVARGEADVYLRLPTRKDYYEKIWDHAAGYLVVNEAGGRATDVHGRELNFALGSQLQENAGVLVTNAALHDAVLAALAEAYGDAL